MGNCYSNELRHIDQGEHHGLQNIIIDGGDDALNEERKEILKNARIALKSKISCNINSLGEPSTIDAFTNQIPSKYQSTMNKQYPEDLPEEDLEEFVEYDPIKLSNGNYYWGYWDNDLLFSGYGKLLLPEEHAYITGYFLKGNLKQGIKLNSDNSIYEGQFNNFKYNGRGKLTYSDGLIYEGDFVDGIREGSGSLLWPDGTKYWGNFRRDKIEGEGEFIWSNGYYYKGSIKNGIFNGKGQLKGSNGSRYNGEFLNGWYHGKGKFTWGDTGSNSNANNKNKNNYQESYTGQYVKGKKQGKGQYQFENGDLFIGNFENNVANGKGEYETNWEIVTGVWENGEIKEKSNVSKKDDFDSHEVNAGYKYNQTLAVDARYEDIDIRNLNYLNFELYNE